MLQPLFAFSDYSLLILRMALGIILIAHGFPKLKDLHGTAAWFAKAGFRPATFWTFVVALIEFFGGIAFLVGFFTQIIALLIVVQFIVAILKVKLVKGLVDGYEFDLLILTTALLLATMGGGVYSADGYWGWILY